MLREPGIYWMPKLRDGYIECCRLRLPCGRKKVVSSFAAPGRVVTSTCEARGLYNCTTTLSTLEQATCHSSRCLPGVVRPDNSAEQAKPRNWPLYRKWLLSLVGFTFCSLASISVSSYAISVSVIQEELQTSRQLALAGISAYTIMFGITPLVLAPLSEIYGRRKIYIFSAAFFAAFHIPQATAANMETMLVARCLSGAGGSTAIALVGGILSDLFTDDERGVPMAMFTFSAFAPTGLGAVAFGYLALARNFRIIVWISFALSATLTAVIFFVQKETRENVRTPSEVGRLRDVAPDSQSGAAPEEKRENIGAIVKASLGRSLRLLLTEPSIQAWTLYVSFAWGVLYLLLVSIPLVFSEVYGFDLGQIGLTYASQIIGACVAVPISLACDAVYRRRAVAEGPEARMYAGIIGGLLITIGAWIFAWTTQPSVHWIAPLGGLTVLYSGLFQIYLTAFNYVTDGYGTWASSALAAMNLGRNIVAAVIPLFGHQAYESVGIHGIGSIVAGLASALALVPVIFLKYGHLLRKRSAFAQR